MNRILFIISACLVLVSCSKREDDAQQPIGFSLSQGTVVGAIRVNFIKDTSAASVLVERREPGGVWVTITGAEGTFDDVHGFDNGLPPGKVFEYRLKNDYPEDADYTIVKSGFAYDILPVEAISISPTSTSNSLTWNEGNMANFQNESEIFFRVMRTADTTKEFKLIKEVGEERSYVDGFSNEPSLQGIPLYYRIDLYYKFEKTSSNGSSFLYSEVFEGKVSSSLN